MDTVLYLVFRQMRRPLLTLILTYSIAILGLVLIPGKDADGNVWYMGFFQAFYFVSYMATTIGFGELPYEFSQAQRIWVVFCIYATVIGWFYAIGTLIKLIQTPAFQMAFAEKRFARIVRARVEPFYLVCGYGKTGSELIESLLDHHQHAVVLDIDEDRISELELANLSEQVPALCVDARRPLHLIEAGLKHPHCAGVVAITNDNEANLKIAITSKLLNPPLKVICRSDSKDIEANMASFGTDRVIDPFDTFGIMLATALQAPCTYLLQQWLTGMLHEQPGDPVYPPNQGKWVVCGFGRFGKAIYHRLRQEGIEIVVVEMHPELTGQPEGLFVHGRGTEAETLSQAGIEDAVGLVAGTDNDANNLSIIATALEMNAELFTIARKNDKDNEELFEALNCNMVMNPSGIIANKIRALLASPLLYEFMGLATYQEDEWACQLVSRISGLIDERVPEVWEVKIDKTQAQAVMQMHTMGHGVTLGRLVAERYDRDQAMSIIVLMLENHEGRVLLPGMDYRVESGDRFLLCGQQGMRHSLEWNLQNINILEYLVLGQVKQRNQVVQYIKKLISK